MPNETVQQILAVLENSLLLAGALLFLWLLLNPRSRSRWLGTDRLEGWVISPLEFGVFVALILLTGCFLQMAVQLLFGGIIAKASDRSGLELCAYGSAFHGGGLLGWLMFRSMRATWQVGIGPDSDPAPAVPALHWSKVLLYSAGTILVCLPVILLLQFGWIDLLRRLGLPEDQQESIAIFLKTRSAIVVAGMFVTTCVLAPINEELLFRAGLYRFCRRRIGRLGALLLSGGIFGIVHFNWAGFLPLSVLGVALALVYEATGSVRVPIVAHGLFNLLNVFIIVLSNQAVTHDALHFHPRRIRRRPRGAQAYRRDQTLARQCLAQVPLRHRR